MFTRTAGKPQRTLNSLSSFFRGIQTAVPRSTLRLGNGIDIDVRPNQGNQELHAYAVLQEHTKYITFEPPSARAGVRMCLERSGATTSNAQLLATTTTG